MLNNVRSNTEAWFECPKMVKSSPITCWEWSRGFQEVMVPRFRDNGAGWWYVVSLTHPKMAHTQYQHRYVICYVVMFVHITIRAQGHIP